MKQKLIALITVVAFAVTSTFTFTGCAGGWQKVETTLGTPAQVQADVTNLATVAYAHLSAAQRAKVAPFVAYLGQASDLDITTLTNLIPTTGNVNADAAISAGVVYVKAAISKWGSHNPTTLAYAHAVYNGFTGAGFGAGVKVQVASQTKMSCNWFCEQNMAVGQEQAFASIAKKFADATPLVTTSSAVYSN